MDSKKGKENEEEFLREKVVLQPKLVIHLQKTNEFEKVY